jgi:hypothetical protein
VLDPAFAASIALPVRSDEEPRPFPPPQPSGPPEAARAASAEELESAIQRAPPIALTMAADMEPAPERIPAREPNRIPGLAPGAAARSASARAAATRMHLSVQRRGHTLMKLTLRPGQLTVGRAADNDVVLESDFVSRTHCALFTVQMGAELRTTVIDLQSLNGILVNGKAVRRHVLVSGDLIRIGDFVLRYFESTPGPDQRP